MKKKILQNQAMLSTNKDEIQEIQKHEKLQTKLLNIENIDICLKIVKDF